MHNTSHKKPSIFHSFRPLCLILFRLQPPNSYYPCCSQVPHTSPKPHPPVPHLIQVTKHEILQLPNIPRSPLSLLHVTTTPAAHKPLTPHPSLTLPLAIPVFTHHFPSPHIQVLLAHKTFIPWKSYTNTPKFSNESICDEPRLTSETFTAHKKSRVELYIGAYLFRRSTRTSMLKAMQSGGHPWIQRKKYRKKNRGEKRGQRQAAAGKRKKERKNNKKKTAGGKGQEWHRGSTDI